jgi:hypothetical protein
MLNSRNLEDKTYEELMAQALLQIPLYSQEWTNFNPSDPGVTILENLTAFEILQQNYINEITPAIQKKLLKLAGFEAEKGRCARVLLKAQGVREPFKIPANQKFVVSDLCFETNRSLEAVPYHIAGVYGHYGGKSIDYSYLLDREVEAPAYIFGESPKAGDSLWLIMDGLPGPGEEIIFYMTVADRHNRNPFGNKGNNTFADLKWECYTAQGFTDVSVRDCTNCFLVSGEVRIRLPQTPAAVCEEGPRSGYAIRVTLQRAEYDVRPKLTNISGFLFEAWQKETKAACYTFNKVSSVTLTSDLLKDGYVTVFCKEEKGSSYRRYMPAYETKQRGRFYRETTDGDKTHTWQFDKRQFGYGPEKVKNAVKIVAYNEEMMRQYYLGTVLGVDRQTIELPAKHIVAEFFCILARRIGEDGESIYDFVRPSRYGKGDLTYYLYENEGKIVIQDAGGFIGADLYVGTLSVTRGSEGNVRSGNWFQGLGLSPLVRFYNPAEGTGGAFRETLEEVKKRFLQDLKRPYTAVTAADYEKLVMETPELCIHKVKAWMSQNQNMVRIAVMPGTDEEFPELPPAYRKAIEKQLEDKRLLTTKIQIVPPVYTPIDVHGTIYVKRQYENGKKMIEEAIRRTIDYIHSERNFGEVLKFDQVFHEIESLDCVEFIYELSLLVRNPSQARLVEADVYPAQNCLCYSGDIVLETGIYT